MSQESRGHSGMVAPLARRVTEDAGAVQIGEAVVTLWHEIHAALTPILGQRGLTALYRRSLHLCAPAHPWLAGTDIGDDKTTQLAALQRLIGAQTRDDAAAGGSALLLAFHELLTSLIGPSLTERLLRSAWTHASSGSAVQDTSP